MAKKLPWTPCEIEYKNIILKSPDNFSKGRENTLLNKPNGLVSAYKIIFSDYFFIFHNARSQLNFLSLTMTTFAMKTIK